MILHSLLPAASAYDPQNHSQFMDLTLSTLPPLPVASKKTARKQRKKLPSFLLLESPVKEALEQIKKDQSEKELKRLNKKANKKKREKENTTLIGLLFIF